MRKTLFSLVLLLLAGLYSANAQNYYYHITVPSGQGLYFVINSDGTSVSVVNPLYIMGWGIEGYSPAPSGNLTIPPSITIHDTNYPVTAIDYGAFYGCDSLTSVNIPNTVTSIESSAFRYCTNLVSVSIPNSVTTIESLVFYQCTSLASVTIPNSVTSIGTYAFNNCTSLTSVSIGDSVIAIGGNAFRGCSSLASATIGNSVTSIGEYAFYNCTSLASVTIGNSVTTIGENAFRGCTGITTVNYNADSCTASSHAFARDSNLVNLNIGSNVKAIPDYMFYGCGLTSVTIPPSVKYMGQFAFANCWRLASVNYNADSCTASSHAFASDSNLVNLNIGSNVKAIPAYMFYGCGLTSVTIPSSVKDMGNGAFSNCWRLATVYFNADSCTTTSYYYSSVFGGDSNLVNLNIGSNVKAIPNYMFCGCGLTSVTIPSSVKYMGEGAFAYCWRLATVNIGNSVDSIGYDAFDGCTNLTETHFTGSISDWCRIGFDNSYANPLSYSHSLYINNTQLTDLVIPNDVTTIKAYAFYGFSTMTSLTLPNSLTSIESEAFAYCSGVGSITLPNSLTNIESEAFAYCSGLESITLPNSLTNIESEVFYNCSGLENVTIPNSVERIGYRAFSGCTGMNNLTLGTGVTEIDLYAFSNCTNLEEITSYNSTAPSLLGGEVGQHFSNVTSTIPVHIPCGSSLSYLSRWNYFSNFVEMAEASFVVESADTTMGTVTVLTEPSCTNPTAVINASANAGFRFDHWSDGNTDNPRVLTVSTDTIIIGYFLPEGVGISDAVQLVVTVMAQGLDVVVEGAAGQRIRVFDMMGRTVATLNEAKETEHFRMMVAGVYLVQVGDGTAQRVVIR